MEIRQLAESDKEQIKDLVLSVYEDTPDAFFYTHAPSKEELEALMEEKIRNIGKTLVDLVALESSKVIGECEIVKVGREGRIGILVRKEERRKGVGTALLRTALNMAKAIGIETVIAYINEKNKIAQNFFEKAGFAKTGQNTFSLKLNG
ncbi:MAG: GNAT family N-acetyltransferase [Candidatus Micrarchaeia archaeon]